MPYAYQKSERIRKNSEFVSVMKAKRLSIDGLSLFYARNGAAHFRVGISVSKKLANAVGRNRLRRQIRAGVMHALRNVTAGYDLVFVARRDLLQADHEQILGVVEKLLHRASLNTTASKGNAS